MLVCARLNFKICYTTLQNVKTPQLKNTDMVVFLCFLQSPLPPQPRRVKNNQPLCCSNIGYTANIYYNYGTLK